MSSRSRRRLGGSIVAGAVVGGLVLLVGSVLVLTRSSAWTGEASAVVLPAPQDDAQALAGYYDTLSQGQVVATMAQMTGLERFTTAAGDALRLSRAEREEISVHVKVIPDTAVVTVRTEAPSARLAERMSDSVLDQTRRFVDGLGQPYRLELVSSARGTAEGSGAGTARSLGVIALVALVTGLAAQQAVQQLGAALDGTSTSTRAGRSPSVDEERGRRVPDTAGDGEFLPKRPRPAWGFASPRRAKSRR